MRSSLDGLEADGRWGKRGAMEGGGGVVKKSESLGFGGEGGGHCRHFYQALTTLEKLLMRKKERVVERIYGGGGRVGRRKYLEREWRTRGKRIGYEGSRMHFSIATSVTHEEG